MTRQRRMFFVLAASLTLAVGCSKPFSGSRLEATLDPGAGVDPASLVVPTPGKHPGEPGYFSHYELYAEIGGWGVTRLAVFLVQPAIRVEHPCLQFLEDRFRTLEVPDATAMAPACPDGPDRPDSPTVADRALYINMERFAQLETIYAVVSTAPTRPTQDASGNEIYDHWPGYDFTDEWGWPPELFYSPHEEDPAKKLDWCNLKKDKVEQYCASLPEGYYVGNPIQLTFARNGRFYGTLSGVDPRTGGPIGGISLAVDQRLDDITGLFLVKEPDPSRISEENIDEDLPPDPNGFVILAATRSGLGRINRNRYRGVIHVTMVSPYGATLRMEVAVFTNLDEDPIGI